MRACPKNFSGWVKYALGDRHVVEEALLICGLWSKFGELVAGLRGPFFPEAGIFQELHGVWVIGCVG